MIRSILLLMFLVLGLSFAVPSVVSAYNPFGGVDCSGKAKSESAICNSSVGDPISGEGGILIKIAGIISYVAGAAAIIIIVVAAIRFITSGGDPGNVKKARDGVLYAVIGIFIVILARVIILFIVNIYN